MTQRDKEIIRLIKSGVSYTEAAEKLGVTRNVVSGVCHRNGVKAKPHVANRNLRAGLLRAWRRDYERRVEGIRSRCADRRA